jgi:hypothetical protein
VIREGIDRLANDKMIQHAHIDWHEHSFETLGHCEVVIGRLASPVGEIHEPPAAE